MRAFIAIDLPDDIKANLVAFQDELKGLNIFRAKFVEKENLHLALKFLGEISEADMDKISKILEELCKKQHVFGLSLKALGAFPSESYVRVLWIGIVKGDAEAKTLHNEIDKAIAGIGNLKPDTRYVNHITLARVKAVMDKAKLKELFGKYKDKEFGSFEAKEIKLIKSTLTREGPVYEPVKEFKLS